MVFAVHACGFRARSAEERINGLSTRVEKIESLIRTSGLSIHDVGTYDAWDRPHYNMAFEFGICFGYHRSAALSPGLRLPVPSTLVLVNTPKEIAYFSDIAGIDVECHASNPMEVIRHIRTWLWGARNSLPGVHFLQQLYREFREVMPGLIEALGHKNVAELAFPELAGLMANWLILRREEQLGRRTMST
ncbi:MAG: hypothetical protein JNN08_31840 [Bryobacterales bacterium]|nr:hypothetical protein [Bryobacterales bacterium]